MAKYFILPIIFFYIFFSYGNSYIYAQVNTTESSAALRKVKINISQSLQAYTDRRSDALKLFLEKYYSPLAEYSDFIVQKSDEYQIPWSLIPAIAGVESTFCKAIPYNSYNCWGWNNGKTYFSGFQNAINTVAKTLRYSYIDRGLTTPESINRIYAPPSPGWGRKVRYFMNQIENSIPSKPQAPPKLSV